VSYERDRAGGEAYDAYLRMIQESEQRWERKAAEDEIARLKRTILAEQEAEGL
jgi:hypothetical protein